MVKKNAKCVGLFIFLFYQHLYEWNILVYEAIVHAYIGMRNGDKKKKK